MKKFFYFLAAMVLLTACKDKINLFTVQDEKDFGNQMYAEIEASPEYPLLATSHAAYPHVNRIMKTILDCGEIKYANEFDWTIRIIDSDVLNAFACPGGKVYVYSGLIKYLDNEAELAGVIAHEIAHIDKRHSTKQLTEKYGVSILVDLIANKTSNQYLQMASQLAGTLGGLAFSRSDENEADNLAVKYLSKTDYNPLGVKGFFEKMVDDGNSGGRLQAFLSTHPSSPDRIKKIEEAWKTYGSKEGGNFETRYAELKGGL